MSIDVRTARAVDRAETQLSRLARNHGAPPDDLEEEETRLRQALLRAYPDRVARRARPGARNLVLSNGTSAVLSEDSVVVDAELMLAIDVEERAAAARGGVSVRLASAIDAEWLLELDSPLLGESDELAWNHERERVERVTRMTYGSVVLDETKSPAPPSEAASALLARAAMEQTGKLAADGGLEALLVRIALAREQLPEASFPDLGADAARGAIERAAAGLVSLSELRATALDQAVLASLSAEQRRLLESELPERVKLPGGRSLLVHYEPGAPPWIASRLQDFFGLAKGPALCKGRLPLTLHLLAPNQRAVQVTRDLEGFWQRHYPAIRRELARKYPRHLWPEDGRHATPPKRGIR